MKSLTILLGTLLVAFSAQATEQDDIVLLDLACKASNGVVMTTSTTVTQPSARTNLAIDTRLGVFTRAARAYPILLGTEAANGANTLIQILAGNAYGGQDNYFLMLKANANTKDKQTAKGILTNGSKSKIADVECSIQTYWVKN